MYEVVTYDDIESIDASQRAAFIDMAGSDAITAQNPPSFWRPLCMQFGGRHDPLGVSRRREC